MYMNDLISLICVVPFIECQYREHGAIMHGFGICFCTSVVIFILANYEPMAYELFCVGYLSMKTLF